MHQQILLYLFKNSRKFDLEVQELFHMQRPRDVTILTDAAQSGERTAK
jgi:hypothetical protein